MTFTVHPEAENELAEVAGRYRERVGRFLAHAFIAEFERVIKLLVKHPGLGTPEAKGLRTFPLRGYPYSVIYRVLESKEIRVLVVAGQRRRPKYWRARE